MPTLIRPATEADATQVLAIYAPNIIGSAISFEMTPPSVEEMARRIAEIQEHFCWLVCEHDGLVLGYTYASRHHVRAAYQWSANLSIYIHPRVHRSGVGRGLYTSLFRVLALQRFYMAYAAITLPHPASVGLHEAMGFEPVGVFEAAGFKLGQWWDVGWWQRPLRPFDEPAGPPLTLREAMERSEWEVALTAGLPFVRV